MATLQLYMKVDGAWTLFLDIPVLEALRLSNRPVKWLRYMAWCIHGQPGRLTAFDGSQVDEEQGLAGLLQSYYYVSAFPPCFIDVNAIDDRTSDASGCDLTRRRAHFRDDVIDRDGTCIITGDAPLNCTACHILPHAKGDNYMRSLMDHRGIQGPARVDKIDDVRNGILLCNGLPRPFGAGEVAFLLTPSLYLAPDDIPANAAGPVPLHRLTIQHIFTPPGVIMTARLAPHNDDVRLDVSPDAPSADILHFFYACAVLRRWGAASAARHLASKGIQDMYYNDAPYNPEEESREEASNDEGSTHEHGFDGRAVISDIMDQLLLPYVRERSSPFKPQAVQAWLETVE
ncbi:hypothetical protein B0H15DRAFT_846503 [Mycena belliarum]|uniref:HNH nuclease domain-containing protein n=1 Tax=Mycena belliarum TaxID=1033014 RepID=A0AAD6U503_9AGAR|nr:hypothetical protein B0H15DRAFT_846503 [Mycena belliae]